MPEPFLEFKAEFLAMATERYGGDEARSEWLWEHPGWVRTLEDAFVGAPIGPAGLVGLRPVLRPLNEAQRTVANILVEWAMAHA